MKKKAIFISLVIICQFLYLNMHAQALTEQWKLIQKSWKLPNGETSRSEYGYDNKGDVKEIKNYETRNNSINRARVEHCFGIADEFRLDSKGTKSNKNCRRHEHDHTRFGSNSSHHSFTRRRQLYFCIQTD